MLEAACMLCGDTFIPADETDLTHLVDMETGEPCGGLGRIVREYR